MDGWKTESYFNLFYNLRDYKMYIITHIFTTSLEPPPPPPQDDLKHPIHGLVSQLYAKKSRRVRWDRPCQRRPYPREKCPEPSSSVQATHRASDGRFPFGALQSALDRINWEHGDPHGHPGRPSSHHHGRQAQISTGLPVRVERSQSSLDILVRGEVDGTSGPVSGERHGRPAEHAADPAFLVELPHDVEGIGVAGIFAGRERLLALDLQKHFHTLKGGGDEGHGDGGEEAGG